MEKELLYFDEGSALREINVINNHVIPAIADEIVPEFESLEIGILDKESFTDLIFSNGEKVKMRLVNVLENQLDKA